jgi:hypothetical protein
MSYELVDATFPIILPAVEKAVLLALCRHAHADGTSSFPSVKLLTGEAGYSERSVQRALRELEAKNYIVAEGSKAGGRHGQTVSYKILIPNADVIAAVKSLWKQGITGASVAPDTTLTGAPVAPDTGFTGASVAGTGASVAPTGAPVAPKSVSEAVKEQVKNQPTTGATEADDVGVVSPKGAGTPRADWAIERFVTYNEKAMPAGKKVKAEIEAMLLTVPKEIADEAITRWSDRREAGFTGLRDPARAMLSELPAFIKLARLKLNRA